MIMVLYINGGNQRQNPSYSRLRCGGSCRNPLFAHLLGGFPDVANSLQRLDTFACSKELDETREGGIFPDGLVAAAAQAALVQLLRLALLTEDHLRIALCEVLRIQPATGTAYHRPIAAVE